MCMIGGGAVLDSDLIQDPSGLRDEAFPEPLNAGLVYPVSSPSLILAVLGVNIPQAG